MNSATFFEYSNMPLYEKTQAYHSNINSKDQDAMKRICYEIPKAEVHVHLEGTLDVEYMGILAQRNGLQVPNDAEELLKQDTFDLQNFFDVYYGSCGLLKTSQDFAELLERYLRRASSEGVLYSEIAVDVQTHLSTGVTFDIIFEGLKAGLARVQRDQQSNSPVKAGMMSKHHPAGRPIEARFIVSIVGEKDEREAIKVVQMAREYKDLIVAIGMATSEVGLPIEKFSSAFRLAKEYGFKTTSHFWDDCLLDQVKRGLTNCGLDRIDHGMCVLDDKSFLHSCASNKTPFTLCPQSILRFGRMHSLDELNLRKMLDLGMLVSVNSDDPAYNETYIGGNYHLVAKELGLSFRDIETLARNSFKQAFLPEDMKSDLDHVLSYYVSHEISFAYDSNSASYPPNA